MTKKGHVTHRKSRYVTHTFPPVEEKEEEMGRQEANETRDAEGVGETLPLTVLDAAATKEEVESKAQWVDFLRFIELLARDTYGGMPTYGSGFIAALRHGKYKRVAAPDLVHMLKGFGLTDEEVLAVLGELPKVTYVQCAGSKLPGELVASIRRRVRERMLRASGAHTGDSTR